MWSAGAGRVRGGAAIGLHPCAPAPPHTLPRRMGANAALFSNKPSAGRVAKYVLENAVRTHLGADDGAYGCVVGWLGGGWVGTLGMAQAPAAQAYQMADANPSGLPHSIWSGLECCRQGLLLAGCSPPTAPAPGYSAPCHLWPRPRSPAPPRPSHLHPTPSCRAPMRQVHAVGPRRRGPQRHLPQQGHRRPRQQRHHRRHHNHHAKGGCACACGGRRALLAGRCTRRRL